VPTLLFLLAAGVASYQCRCPLLLQRRPFRLTWNVSPDQKRFNGLLPKAQIPQAQFHLLGYIAQMAEERVQRRLAAIVVADVVGYSRLMEEDEIATLAVLKERRATILQPIVCARMAAASSK
jgi:hypothetical protein